MIEIFLSFLLMLNPDCRAADREFLQWGQPGESKVESSPVPEDQVWLVRACGVFTTDDTGAANIGQALTITG